VGREDEGDDYPGISHGKDRSREDSVLPKGNRKTNPLKPSILKITSSTVILKINFFFHR
jgi:hypothetical protein